MKNIYGQYIFLSDRCGKKLDKCVYEQTVSPGEDVGLRGVGGGGREGRGGLWLRDPLADPEGESIPFTRPLGADGRSIPSETVGDGSLLLQREKDTGDHVRNHVWLQTCDAPQPITGYIHHFWYNQTAISTLTTKEKQHFC